MQTNWSLIVNVLLLIGVIFAISRLMKARRQSLNPVQYEPSLSKVEKSIYDTPPLNDDIIAVRKVIRNDLEEDDHNDEQLPRLIAKNTGASLIELECKKVLVEEEIREKPHKSEAKKRSTVMMFLLAKENRQFAGYELLQTLLASGLRFGEGHIFHRHQFVNGQGPVLCSVAAATPSGIFDLQNIGAFSVRGLCLYMEVTMDAEVDAERFSVMVETARHLQEGLDAHLLDDQRKPLKDDNLHRYYALLQIEPSKVEMIG